MCRGRNIITSVKKFLTAETQYAFPLGGRWRGEAVTDEGHMEKKKNKKLTSNAQELRKSMTKEERHLWYDFLKPLPITVNRQKVIGPYIVDFYCAQANLVIELDGSQHFEEHGQSVDRVRDAYLMEQGLIVLRYPNNEVTQHFGCVCQDIWQHLFSSSPALQELPPKGKPM